MSIRVFYNEIDRFCCDWLSNLMDRGHIRPGTICDKSIADLAPEDVRGYDIAHFFAGIGVWDYALTLAGWRADGRVTWTGSCPCQPFSAAGKRKGHEDERHLWPAWFRLIGESRPVVVFGEQIGGGDGAAWLDHLAVDLEGIGYALGAVSAAACGVGAPHIRQRIYFVADANGTRSGRNAGAVLGPQGGLGMRCVADGVESCGATRPMADANGIGPPAGARLADEGYGPKPQRQGAVGASFWSDCEWLPCLDGKARPTQPGLFPLAHGTPARMGRVRAYGNAIVPQLAAEVIKAYSDI